MGLEYGNIKLAKRLYCRRNNRNKEKNFNENFTTMDEVNIVKQVVERRIQKENLKV